MFSLRVYDDSWKVRANDMSDAYESLSDCVDDLAEEVDDENMRLYRAAGTTDLKSIHQKEDTRRANLKQKVEAARKKLEIEDAIQSEALKAKIQQLKQTTGKQEETLRDLALQLQKAKQRNSCCYGLKFLLISVWNNLHKK